MYFFNLEKISIIDYFLTNRFKVIDVKNYKNSFKIKLI